MNKKMQGKIRELHTAFKTVKEIADELKIDGAEVVYELEAMGYRPRYEKDKPEPSDFLKKSNHSKPTFTYTRATPEMKEEIRKLREEGKTQQEIANKLGIKRSTVDSVLRTFRSKEKEPAPAATDADSDKTSEKVSCDYHTAFEEVCQEQIGIISKLEEWLGSFIEEIYNNQSEDWQHGFDTGEKLSELRTLVRKAKGGSA